MTEALRIVVIAPDLDITDPQDDYAINQAERSRILRICLLENGYNLIASLPADTFLTERLAQLQPDMIIVDAESESRDALEHVVMATRDARRPIVMFTNDDNTSRLKDAVAAGVSATSSPACPASASARSWKSPWRASSTSRRCARNWPRPAPSSTSAMPSCRTARSSTGPRAC